MYLLPVQAVKVGHFNKIYTDLVFRLLFHVAHLIISVSNFKLTPLCKLKQRLVAT